MKWTGCLTWRFSWKPKHTSPLLRRIRRDALERGYDMNDVLYRFEHHVMPIYESIIEPLKHQADFIIPNNGKSIHPCSDCRLSKNPAVKTVKTDSKATFLTDLRFTRLFLHFVAIRIRARCSKQKCIGGSPACWLAFVSPLFRTAGALKNQPKVATEQKLTLSNKLLLLSHRMR